VPQIRFGEQESPGGAKGGENAAAALLGDPVDYGTVEAEFVLKTAGGGVKAGEMGVRMSARLEVVFRQSAGPEEDVYGLGGQGGVVQGTGGGANGEVEGIVRGVSDVDVGKAQGVQGACGRNEKTAGGEFMEIEASRREDGGEAGQADGGPIGGDGG
jgi:hypothetical protein